MVDACARESRAQVTSRVRRMRAPGPPRGVDRTELDPLAPAVIADPYPWYRALHRGGPVHYSEKRDVWIVSRHEDVRAAARAHDWLSSADGVTRFRTRLPMMLTMDRPGHTRLRRLVARDFTRDALERWRPAIEEMTRSAFDRMLAAGSCDAVAEVASPLPVDAIARVLGVPPEDVPAFRRWSDGIVEGFGVAPDAAPVRTSARVVGSAMKLQGYLAAQVAQRRAQPGDDLLSRLVNSDDEPLSDDELFWFALLLLVAGNETTANLIGTMLLSLAEHPEEYALLREDPGLVPAAVEESLRYVSPIQGFYRTAVSDYDVDGVTIPAGARVLLLFGAANRDPRKYPDPDAFAIERNPTDHVAFGLGIHFCLGAHLARLEGAVVLRELLARAASIELAGEPVWSRNPTLRGLARLPLVIRAAA